MVIVVFGVSGVGKTTVGKLLAERLGCEFLDADDFHSAENKKKMSLGIPLDDSDRKQWLDELRALIESRLNTETEIVLACSALKKRYRDRLRVCDEVEFVYLKGRYEMIAERIGRREGHFMSPSLLQSQFEALEEPESDEWTFDVEDAPESIVGKILDRLVYKEVTSDR